MSAASLKPYQRTLAPRRSSFMRPWIACSILFAAAFHANADVRLSGVIGTRTIDDNVVIAPNSRCTLNGTIIKGNVIVQPGARLLANTAFVDGNVIGKDGAIIDLRKYSRVEGNVQADGTRTVIVRTGTKISGNVQVKNTRTPANADALLVIMATVTGDIQAEMGSSRLRVISSKIDGSLQFVENHLGLYRVHSNRIKGDLQFFKNRGQGTITANRVGGNLQTKENYPRPVISGNTVGGELEVE